MRDQRALLWALVTVTVLSFVLGDPVDTGFPKRVLVNTTREAEAYWGGWDTLRADSYRHGDDYILSMLVHSEDELHDLQYLEQQRVLQVKEVRQEAHSRRLSLGKFDFMAEFPCYRTMQQAFDLIDTIVANHPDIASKASLGNSHLGRNTPVLLLTNQASTNPKAPAMLIAGMHPRELTPVETIVRLAEYLVDNKNDPTISFMLDHTVIHLVFVANPDTRAKVEETENSLRKNRHQYTCISRIGVDLNRNFPAHYGLSLGSSNSACSEKYRGPFALSEAESQNIYTYAKVLFGGERPESQQFNVCDENKAGLFIDIHSFGEFVFFPWGHEDTPAPNNLYTMASKMAVLAGGYRLWGPGENFVTPVSGDATDSMYARLCVPSFGYELGSTFFEKCSDYDDIWDAARPSLLYALQTATKAYLLSRGPDIISHSVAGDILRVRASDSSLTKIASQAISTIRLYTQDPYATGLSGQAMTPDDGSFDETTEDATFDMAGISGTIYVEAEDVAGFRGPVLAVERFGPQPTPSPPTPPTPPSPVAPTPPSPTVVPSPEPPVGPPIFGFLFDKQ